MSPVAANPMIRIDIHGEKGEGRGKKLDAIVPGVFG
jgi:hypothetical protein